MSDPCEGVHSSPEIAARCPIGRKARAAATAEAARASAQKQAESAEAARILGQYETFKEFAKGYHPERHLDKP